MAIFRSPNTTYSIPDPGQMFIGSGETPGSPQAVYIRVGDAVHAINVQELGMSLGARNGKQGQGMGLNYLEERGINFNSLPQYNLADVNQAFRRTGGIQSTGDFNQFSQLVAQSKTVQPGSPTGTIDHESDKPLNFTTPDGRQVNAAGGQATVSQPTNTAGGTPGGQPNGQGGSSIFSNDPDLQSLVSSLPPELQQLYDNLAQQLETTIEAGKTVNPDIELSPDMIQQFYDQAGAELSPYFQEQMKMIRTDLDTSLKRLTEDYKRGVSEVQRQFPEALAQQANAEAEAGTTFSSGRERRLSNLVQDQQNRLDDAFRTTQRQAEDIGRQAERTLGSMNLGGLAPELQTANVSATGVSLGGSRRLFSPEGNIMGALPKEQTTATELRKSQLEEAERKQRTLDYI